MGHYLITGRASAGKSTIAGELAARGFTVYDSDQIPKLARWENLSTGRPAQVDNAGEIDYDAVGWNWSDARLNQLLAEHPGELFLCGSAHNQLKFHGQFDLVFVLTIDPATIASRLANRATSDYGRHPNTIPKIIEQHRQFVADALRLGGISIDATMPVKEVLHRILRQVRQWEEAQNSGTS